MCTCELLLASMMNILIIFKSTKTLLNIETVKLEVYPAKESMLKAPAAPRALVDIMRCLMSRITVDAGWCLQCSPSTVHQEIEDPRKNKKKTSAVTRKKRAVAETLSKNLIARTLEQVSPCGRRFRRHALPTLCARGELAWGNSRATQQKNDGAGCVVSRTRSWRQVLLFISTEGRRWSVEDEPGRHESSINY
jgi:hypothetical protein